MTTLEQKIDLALRWIASDDDLAKAGIEDMIMDILKEESKVVKVSDIDTIQSFFVEIGITPNLKGFRYLSYAIELIRTRREYYFEGICGRLYTDIAKKFETTPARVERNIRHAITSAYTSGLGRSHHIETFAGSININKGVCTNTAFISICDHEIDKRIRRG